MKKVLFIVTLFFAAGLNELAQAQKAYDNVTYKSNIYGSAATLTLADGYLLASKVIIHSKYGDQVFAPNASEADRYGNLRFDAVKGTGRYKNMKGSWILMSGLDKPDLPAQVKAIYWDGKSRKRILFK